MKGKKGLMELKDHFQREMLALRELGREAMTRNPALVPFFGTPGRDTDVERLLEGFSFLAGRLQEKIDDELPEITYGIFGMLWPNYLRPVPAASVIQYQLTSNITGASVIPRGTLVDSVPVDGTRCRFQTIYDTEILPLRVADQRMIERHGTAIIAVRFAVTNGGLRTLRLSRLRIFFTGDKEERSIPYTLYLNLVRRLKEVRFVIRDGGEDGEFRENVTAVLPPSCVRPLGFQEDEGLYPYTKEVALGYRVLQEYFCYPEKFLFVEISRLEQGLGKETMARFSDQEEFELHFVLPALPDGYEAFQAKNWNLFCTPVVNIFPFTAVPYHATQERPEYKVMPDTKCPEHFLVYSVEHVGSWHNRGKKGDSFESIKSLDASQYLSKDSSTCYRLHVRPTLDRKNVETYTALEQIPPEGLTVDLKLLCTNGLLPIQLGLGDICENISKDAATSPFKNILPVSPPYPPPCSEDTLWKLFSNMSLNNIQLANIQAFRALISTYAFPAMHTSVQARALERHLQSILAIETPATDRLFNGIPKRGAQTKILMDQSFFSCEGAMYLFGSALNEFLGMYATVNSFHQFILKEAAQGKEYCWPARLGSVMRR